MAAPPPRPPASRTWRLVLVAAALIALGVGGYLIWSPRAPSLPPRDVPPRDPPPSTRPAAAPAQLRVTSDPLGARIIIDGQDAGRYAPDLLELTTDRPHRLRLELEGFEPWEEELELEPGEVRELGVRLTQMPP